MRQLLEIEDLRVEFTVKGHAFAAVSDVDLKLDRGRTLGLVGESGSGKTVTSLAVLRLIPSPPGRIAGGRIWFQGRDLLPLSEKEMVGIRGRDISMVFQEPMTSLNPVFTAGDQVAEVYRIHLKLGRTEAFARATEMLAKVGIPDPVRRAREYPHQMSGGMRQRVLIAIALACRPSLLIADEPTTALDVTVQAQILALMEQLRDEMGTALLLITHDLGVVAESADDVAVMYAGRIVEQAACRPIFESPWHPYTAGLLHSRPVLGKRGGGRRLDAIPGTVPDLKHLPPGCSFEPRCPRRQRICVEQMPPLEEKSPGRMARCWVPPE
ncbi:MAG TPA: ABC transporter ATP-binding protein [Candidatus Methanoperedens sp.]|nr:ABC transporter ATP-binding protein [Candidatus Methanoperedens sp.]